MLENRNGKLDLYFVRLRYTKDGNYSILRSLILKGSVLHSPSPLTRISLSLQDNLFNTINEGTHTSKTPSTSKAPSFSSKKESVLW